MLRAVQGHSAPRPILKGLRVTDSYMRRMPSFPKGVTKTQFILEDENQGKFNHSVMYDVVVALQWIQQNIAAFGVIIELTQCSPLFIIPLSE